MQPRRCGRRSSPLGEAGTRAPLPAPPPRTSASFARTSHFPPPSALVDFQPPVFQAFLGVVASAVPLTPQPPVPAHTLVPGEAPWGDDHKLLHRCSESVPGAGAWAQISGHSAGPLSQANDFPAHCDSLPPGPTPGQMGRERALVSFSGTTGPPWGLLPTSLPSPGLSG